MLHCTLVLCIYVYKQAKCSQMPKNSGFTKLYNTIANQKKKVYNTSMKNKGGVGKKHNDMYI